MQEYANKFKIKVIGSNPMDSMILAHWACSTAKPVKKQKISY